MNSKAQNILFRATLFIFTLIGHRPFFYLFSTTTPGMSFNINARDYQFNRQGGDTECGGEIRKTV